MGSGPGSLENEPGFIDSRDLVVRVNNYKIFPQTGFRTDVLYSFFGTSIRNKVTDLNKDGVKLCMCKLPNAKPLQSRWHEENKKPEGIDYRYIYERRAPWWFCDTYIPTIDEFMAKFELLGRHQPTTGFSAILDILSFEPASLYLTGFDFFQSKTHNVDEKWVEKNTDDPIKHMPGKELTWITDNASKHPMAFDRTLTRILSEVS